MEKICLVWQGRLPGTNDMIGAINRNRYGGNHLKRETQNDLRWVFLQQANGQKMTGKSIMHVRFYEPNARRDEDNVMGGLKYIMDTIKELEIIPDDSPKWVHILPEVFRDPENPRIEIDIEAET